MWRRHITMSNHPRIYVYMTDIHWRLHHVSHFYFIHVNQMDVYNVYIFVFIAHSLFDPHFIADMERAMEARLDINQSLLWELMYAFVTWLLFRFILISLTQLIGIFFDFFFFFLHFNFIFIHLFYIFFCRWMMQLVGIILNIWLDSNWYR